MQSYAYDRLSVVDNSFLALESPTSPQHVAAVLCLDARPVSRPDGGIDIDTIRTYIAARLHLIPRYRQRLATVPLGNRLVWIDDEHFNIHYHVRHTSLPRPGDERQLKRLAARIVSQQLDRAKPLWEIWVVEGLEGDRFALVAKTHHSMVDGISGVDLLAVLLSPEAGHEFSEGPTWIPRPAPTPLQIFRDEWMRRLREPLELLWETPCPFGAPFEIVGKVWESVRALGETLGAQVLAAVSEWTSTTLLSSAVRLSTRSRPFNLVVTNVPGPQIPLYMLGAELGVCFPMLALLPNQALGVALFSYAGKLCWGFIADWDLIPDLHDFVVAIETSFRELQSAAGTAAA